MIVARVLLTCVGKTLSEPDIRIGIMPDNRIQVLIAGCEPAVVSSIEDAIVHLMLQPLVVPYGQYLRVLEALERRIG